MVFLDIDLSKKQKFVDTIVGVLVLYKIKLEESSSFVTLTNSLQKLQASLDLVVYDNSPNPMLKSSDFSQKANWKIHYIHDSTNPGVSKAYNEGAKIGQKLNKKWILLLDQDTTFSSNIMESYFNATEMSQSQNIFAPYLYQENPSILLSPSGYNFKRGFPIKNTDHLKSGITSLYGKTLLSSGLLINLMTFQDLGGYNNNLKLDFSDFYFMDQFRKLYSSFYLIDSKCLHELSRTDETSLEKSIERFSICCESAHHFSENAFEFFQIIFYLFLRSSMLSLKYKSWIFQKILYKTIIKGI
jgi:rhamnosyltransferase